MQTPDHGLRWPESTHLQLMYKNPEPQSYVPVGVLEDQVVGEQHGGRGRCPGGSATPDRGDHYLSSTEGYLST